MAAILSRPPGNVAERVPFPPSCAIKQSHKSWNLAINLSHIPQYNTEDAVTAVKESPVQFMDLLPFAVALFPNFGQAVV